VTLPLSLPNQPQRIHSNGSFGLTRLQQSLTVATGSFSCLGAAELGEAIRFSDPTMEGQAHPVNYH
jgi:hypothetical protein